MRGTTGSVMAALILILCLPGCALHRYQVCVMDNDGIGCLAPQDRQGAEMKALAVNATAQGAGVAWVQKAQRKAKPKPAPAGDPISQ